MANPNKRRAKKEMIRGIFEKKEESSESIIEKKGPAKKKSPAKKKAPRKSWFKKDEE